jgi:hypothetical protein
MNAILITLNIILLSSLGALGYQWPPALFAFLIVGPLSVLSIWGVSNGGVSARVIFVTTAAAAIAAIAGASYFSHLALYGVLIVGPITILGMVDLLQAKRRFDETSP